jgi:hypothetical protein
MPPETLIPLLLTALGSAVGGVIFMYRVNQEANVRSDTRIEKANTEAYAAMNTMYLERIKEIREDCKLQITIRDEMIRFLQGSFTHGVGVVEKAVEVQKAQS